eukprot:436403-Pelagomonas_calceolata.AAC.1
MLAWEAPVRAAWIVEQRLNKAVIARLRAAVLWTYPVLMLFWTAPVWARQIVEEPLARSSRFAAACACVINRPPAYFDFAGTWSRKKETINCVGRENSPSAIEEKGTHFVRGSSLNARGLWLA